MYKRQDEVTRVNLDGLNRPMYERFKSKTIGELREWVLDHRTTSEELGRAGRAFTGEVVAAVAKLMSNMDLIYAARKLRVTATCNTTIGEPGTLSARLQPNHPTDDPENFNCLFCYCPLYALGPDCGGNFSYTESGVKDCTRCTLPHRRDNYGYITSKFQEIARRMAESRRRGV